jgi:hypothetical protein
MSVPTKPPLCTDVISPQDSAMISPQGPGSADGSCFHFVTGQMSSNSRFVCARAFRGEADAGKRCERVDPRRRGWIAANLMTCRHRPRAGDDRAAAMVIVDFEEIAANGTPANGAPVRNPPAARMTERAGRSRRTPSLPARFGVVKERGRSLLPERP